MELKLRAWMTTSDLALWRAPRPSLSRRSLKPFSNGRVFCPPLHIARIYSKASFPELLVRSHLPASNKSMTSRNTTHLVNGICPSTFLLAGLDVCSTRMIIFQVERSSLIDRRRTSSLSSSSLQKDHGGEDDCVEKRSVCQAISMTSLVWCRSTEASSPPCSS